MSSKAKDQNKGFLAWVERVGNKIPHPFILFLWPNNYCCSAIIYFKQIRRICCESN